MKSSCSAKPPLCGKPLLYAKPLLLGGHLLHGGPFVYGKRSCCTKPVHVPKRSCGCGAVAVPVPSEPSEGGEENPFRDDELQPPPIPAAEAKHTAGDSKVAGRPGPTPATRSVSTSPQRFRPVNAVPIPRTVSEKKSAFRREGATESTAENKGYKKKYALIDPVRLAELVLP